MFLINIDSIWYKNEEILAIADLCRFEMTSLGNNEATKIYTCVYWACPKWWRLDMETCSPLLSTCDWHSTTSNAINEERRCFLCCYPEQIVELRVISDVMTPNVIEEGPIKILVRFQANIYDGYDVWFMGLYDVQQINSTAWFVGNTEGITAILSSQVDHQK